MSKLLEVEEQVDDIDNNNVFITVTSHALDRRRHRKKIYYICPCCNNQFMYNRPKDRTCPVCFTEQLKYVQTVDEFMENAIREYSDNTLLNEDSEDFNARCQVFSNWLLANIWHNYVKEKAELIIKNVTQNLLKTGKESY